MTRRAVPNLRPPLPRSPHPKRRSFVTSAIAFIVIILGLGLIWAEYAWLRGRQESHTVAQANELVADRIDLARAHLAAQHWDEAIRHLEDAQSVEYATNHDEAITLLEQAQRGQAEALLEAAKLAIARKDAVNALHLLQAYAAHPRATQLEQNRLLRADLHRATSSDAAAELLASLSEEALTIFTKEGRLTQDDGLRTDAAREIFKDTLRRQLAQELSKRAARREAERLAEQRRAVERAQRILILRNAPAFRALTTFIGETSAKHRERQALAQRQETELGQLFEQLDVNDQAEQATIRADLMGGEGGDSLTPLVDHKRAEVKRAYRAAPEYNAGDRELFDQLVDQELEKLLETLKHS